MFQIMNIEEEQLFKQLVYCYRRIGIPTIKETLEIFMECSDKQKMVDQAEQWANSMRYNK